MRELLFDVPWWLPTIFGLVGVALIVNGNRRKKVNIRTAGLVFLGVGILWALLSYVVETPR